MISILDKNKQTFNGVKAGSLVVVDKKKYEVRCVLPDLTCELTDADPNTTRFVHPADLVLQ